MKKHLNTLFVTLDGAFLKKDGAAVEVRHEGETMLRVPLHNLDSIVTFGWDTCASAALLSACGEAGVGLSFHSPHGKFLASTSGGVSGNILLRRAQYKKSEDENEALLIAKNCIAAKLANTRNLLKRQLRDHSDIPNHSAATKAVGLLKNRLGHVRTAIDLESLRGIEGEAATIWFGVFNDLIRATDPKIRFTGRVKRPPTDPVNGLLSFTYALLTQDCRSACESVGLDSQCGFLHQDRPGRHSLALDLIEEFRPVLADRFVLTLLNRKQITSQDFDYKENGAVILKEDSLKKVLAAWQERKQDEIEHPFLGDKMTVGLLPFIQCRLLARYLRGDYDAYPAMIWRG